MIAVVRGRPGQQIFLMGHPDESRQNGFSSKCESNFERKESVEAEIGRKMSLKYFFGYFLDAVKNLAPREEN